MPMTPDSKANPLRLLVYEPRVEGHHPGWLKFITEDLLSAGFELVLAVNQCPPSRKIIEEHLGDLITGVKLIPAVDENGRPRHGSTTSSLLECLDESGADRAFLCALDELASHTFRRAAVGIRPPERLRGRIGGIYHRPRFTISPWWSINRWLKATGFRASLAANWIKPLLFLDEYLTRSFKIAFPEKPIFFLPDPCPDDFTGDPRLARTALGIPPDLVVFLFFGVGAKRKGLHLAVDAMLRLENKNTLLLIAGKQNPSRRVRQGIDLLQRQDRAIILDRYVSSDEEKQCFQASDVVLLPYVDHFGTSGILSRAMAAGKPVIASDEHLLGRLVKDNAIGWIFPSGNVAALKDCLIRAVEADCETQQRMIANSIDYAGRYSRDAFRKALLASLAAL